MQRMVTLFVPLDQKANESLAKKFIFVQRGSSRLEKVNYFPQPGVESNLHTPSHVFIVGNSCIPFGGAFKLLPDRDASKGWGEA